jgi:hypothetical protein
VAPDLSRDGTEADRNVRPSSDSIITRAAMLLAAAMDHDDFREVPKGTVGARQKRFPEQGDRRGSNPRPQGPQESIGEP